MRHRIDRRGKARAALREEGAAGWWAWVVIGAGLLAAVPVFGQTVPEVVRPQSPSPVLPPGSSGGLPGATPQPRSENPLVGSGRPVPDNGVVAPPVSGAMPVIRPSQRGEMPVIVPPGSPGGDRGVVPK